LNAITDSNFSNILSPPGDKWIVQPVGGFLVSTSNSQLFFKVYFMSNSGNPYQAPVQSVDPIPVGSNAMRLADLGKRFLGALIDGLVGLVLAGPGYVLMLVGQTGDPDQPGALFFVGLLMLVLGSLAILAAQIYLLFTRSQTIGKYVMKTQIVDFQTGQRADFVHAFVLRLFVNGLIGAIPCIGLIYAIVDICFIFREDRRCIHDMLASTVVVDIA